MNQPITSKGLLTALNVIYFSLVFVMTFFGLIVLYLNYSGTKEIVADEDFAQVLQYVLLVLTPAGIGAGYLVFKQQLAAIQTNATLRGKLNRYQTAILIRSACLELPGLFGAVAAMITGVNYFLLFTTVIIVIFVLVRPTPFTITNDLGLSQVERSILENPLGKIE